MALQPRLIHPHPPQIITAPLMETTPTTLVTTPVTTPVSVVHSNAVHLVCLRDQQQQQ